MDGAPTDCSEHASNPDSLRLLDTSGRFSNYRLRLRKPQVTSSQGKSRKSEVAQRIVHWPLGRGMRSKQCLATQTLPTTRSSSLITDDLVADLFQAERAGLGYALCVRCTSPVMPVNCPDNLPNHDSNHIC